MTAFDGLTWQEAMRLETGTILTDPDA